MYDLGAFDNTEQKMPFGPMATMEVLFGATDGQRLTFAEIYLNSSTISHVFEKNATPRRAGGERQIGINYVFVFIYFIYFVPNCEEIPKSVLFWGWGAGGTNFVNLLL